MTLKINVLGTEYRLLEATEQDDPKLIGKDGYCDTTTKECVIDSMEQVHGDCKGNLPEYKKAVKRHELIHAFFYESGLDMCSWANNEELVDWIALQFPKLARAFKEADCL